jgi:hypothetical protein
VGVEAADEEGPLHEQYAEAGDDEHHGQRADRDDEPAVQRHHGSRIV